MLLVQRGHIELKEFQMTQRGHVWGPSEVFIVVYWRRVEKAMAPHSSTLAWKIPWMKEPGRLQSMGSLRVGYD